MLSIKLCKVQLSTVLDSKKDTSRWNSGNSSADRPAAETVTLTLTLNPNDPQLERLSLYEWTPAGTVVNIKKHFHSSSNIEKKSIYNIKY